jgi:hypothetical protein
VSVFKRNNDAIRRQIGKALERVRREAGLGLLAVCDDGRTSLLKAADGIFQRALGDALELSGWGILPIGSVGMCTIAYSS